MIVAKKHDWKNPADYEYTFHLTSNLWAWQFLRRNPEYQAEWEQVRKMQMKMDWYSSMMERLKEESTNPSRMGEMILEMIIQSVPPYSARKWGFYLGYVNPEKDTPATATFIRSFGDILLDPRRERRYKQNMLEYFEMLKAKGINITGRNDFIREEIDSLKKETVPEGSVAVTFDLTLPITPQVEYAQKILTECQNDEKRLGGLKIKTPRQHVSIWQRYLRILDAKAEGADNKEIASHIFPEHINEYPDYQGNRMVKDAFKSANKLVNKGYLKLLVRDPLEIL